MRGSPIKDRYPHISPWSLGSIDIDSIGLEFVADKLKYLSIRWVIAQKNTQQKKSKTGPKKDARGVAFSVTLEMCAWLSNQR